MPPTQFSGSGPRFRSFRSLLPTARLSRLSRGRFRTATSVYGWHRRYLSPSGSADFAAPRKSVNGREGRRAPCEYSRDLGTPDITLRVSARAAAQGRLLAPFVRGGRR